MMQNLNFERPNERYKHLINQLNEQFGPYADTAYGTLLTWWDMYDDLEFAELNGNVIVRSSYASEGKVAQLSLIGAHDIKKTIKTILDWLASKQLDESLYFLPEYIIDSLDKNKGLYAVKKDLDISEYILSTQEQKDVAGKNFANIRYKINLFGKTYGDKITINELNLSAAENRNNIIKHVNAWQSKTNNDTERSEEKVIERSLRLYNDVGLHCLTIRVDGELVGCILFKLLAHGYVNINHIKVNYKYRHIFIYAIHALATHLDALYPSYTYMNIEQDLGIKGLREFKQLQRPIKMLYKYSLTRRRN